MKKTVFEGIVNDVKYDSVEGYNKAIQEAIANGGDVKASSKTEIVDEPAEEHPLKKLPTDLEELLSLGQVDFSTIPVFMTDNVSLKWGSGTSENSGGIGGVVDIKNDVAFDKGLILDLKQNYGSFNTLGSFASFGFSGKTSPVREFLLVS